MHNQQQNESVFDFIMKDFEIIPPGQYIAKFKDVQRTNHDKYGAGVIFVFEIAQGEFSGLNISRIGKPEPTPKNATGKIMSGILGHMPEKGQPIDLRPFIGKYFNVLVEPTEGEKTRIAQVWAYQQGQSMPVQTQVPQVNPFPPNPNGGGFKENLDNIPF